MMMSRLMRGRLSSSIKALRRDISPPHCHITGTVTNLELARYYCLYHECAIDLV